jgi:hypothetical protein
MSSINLHIECQVTPEKLAVFVKLLEEFLPEASIPNIEHLRGIYVVPDAAKDAVVNEFQGNKPGSYVAGDMSNACAVPVEKDASLQCYIIFGESFVQKINPEQPYAAEIVLTVLEEMLHVRLYSTLWERRGYLYPPSDLSCTTDLLKMCSNFRDEYIVNRWKYGYFVSQAEKTGTPISVSDFPLIDRLNQAEGKLSGIVFAAASAQMSIGDAWVSLLRCVYRDIFELLARYAALLAAIGPERIENLIDLSKSQFYQHSVAPYWQQIQKELERSYTSDLTEAHDALENIVMVMKAFLASIGVTYHKTAAGDCHVDFVFS